MKQYSIAAFVLILVMSVAFNGVYRFSLNHLSPERSRTQMLVRDAEKQTAELAQLQQSLKEQKGHVVSYEQYQTLWEQRVVGYTTSQQVANHIKDTAERAFNLQVPHIVSDPIEIWGRQCTATEIEVRGTFPDILAWLGQTEADIDFLRHASGVWRPQSQGKLALTLKLVTDFSLLNHEAVKPPQPAKPKQAAAKKS